MALPPLVLRELYQAPRRRWGMRLRTASAAVSMGCSIWAMLVWGPTSGNLGARLFAAEAYGAAAVAILAGLFLAADSLSRERREGTLGFLFLTHLSARDVVWGKFASAGLLPASILVAALPALALLQLLGGTVAGAFWRTLLALLLALGFSLSASLFSSSQFRDHRRAFAVAGALLCLLSPLWMVRAGLDSHYAGNPAAYWILGGAFALFSLWLLAGTARTLERSWRQDETSTEASGRSQARVAVQPELLERSPIAWLMGRREPGKRGRVFWILAAATAASPILFGIPEGWPVILLGIHLGAQWMVLGRSAYAFYTDRQDGSLELLLGTRTGTAEIFQGLAGYLWRRSRPVLIGLTLLDLLLALGWTGRGFDGPGRYTWAPLAMGATLWISGAGMAWVGVYRALMTNHPALAVPAAFSRLSLVPLVLSLLFLSVPGTDPRSVACFWVVTCGLFALFFAMDAKTALERHGRDLLLRPFSEKPPHIESDWSFIDWTEVNAAPAGSRADSAPVTRYASPGG